MNSRPRFYECRRCHAKGLVLAFTADGWRLHEACFVKWLHVCKPTKDKR